MNPSFRVRLELLTRKPRIDQVLLEELRRQNRNLQLRNISRSEFKVLFKKKRIRIKGQSAVPSSSLAQGSTDVDIIGFEDDASTASASALPDHGRDLGGPASKPSARPEVSQKT